MKQFLALTLAGRLPPQPEGETANFRWEWREAGVLQLTPHHSCSQAMVLSAGSTAMRPRRLKSSIIC